MDSQTLRGASDGPVIAPGPATRGWRVAARRREVTQRRHDRCDAVASPPLRARLTRPRGLLAVGGERTAGGGNGEQIASRGSRGTAARLAALGPSGCP